MNHKILIIEDNPEIASLIQLHLKDINCDADIATDGAEGLDQFNQGDYQLVILDLMLPVLDGLEVCKRIRLQTPYVPIIMLTSKSSELDRVLGLEIGADDYLTKPFSLMELMARVKAQFRHLAAVNQPASSDVPAAAPTPPTIAIPPTEPLQFNDLSIDPDKHRVILAGKKVELTAKEFDLLLHFASNVGHVYSRADLLDQVWNYNHVGYEHTVNSHINRLRNKIEADSANPRYILTIWGVGYKFNDEL